MPLLLIGAGVLGIGGFAIGYGTSKTTDKLFTYGVTAGALFIAYKMVKAK